MKKLFLLCLWTLLYACSAPAEQPQNRLSKDKMAEIIADLAIYNQSYYVDPKINLEDADRFVLKKHNISAKDFQENYQFYTYTPSALDEIFGKAKKIILKKEPNLKIENKKEEPAIMKN